jgi:hypothetical protein
MVFEMGDVTASRLRMISGKCEVSLGNAERLGQNLMRGKQEQAYRSH